MLSEKNSDFLLAAAAWILMAFIAVAATGTGDDGDSVQHFLYAKYAFDHPANFFNHWAKPLFVMLAAPFAQFGFVGVKLLNVSLLAFQIWLLLRIAAHFQLPNRWLLAVFSLAAPMNLTHSLSGLTEPLFAVWLVGPMLLLLRGRVGWAYFLWSFLPFVRSEGLIILCPLLIYMVWRGHFRWVPMLAAGHILMTLPGWPIHGDLFWVFNKIPYATLDAAYGSGTWLHFAEHMPDIIGWVLCGLLVIGLGDGLVRLILSKKWLKNDLARDEAWLIYGLFLAFFLAHTLFWAKGIFKSFGLLRVFLGIMPCLLFICLRGQERLFSWLKMEAKSLKINRMAHGCLFAGLAVNMYFQLSWKGDFGPSIAQKAMSRAAAVIKKDFPDWQSQTVYLDAVDAARQLELDFFDRKKVREGWRLFTGEPVPPQSIVVWDDWFMRMEANVSLEKLQADPRLILRGIFEEDETRWPGRSRIFIFYTDSSKVASLGDFLSRIRFDTLPIDRGGFEKNGQKGFLVNKKHQFSPGFEASLSSFQPGDELEISFEAAVLDTTDFPSAAFVFEVSGNEKSSSWIPHDLNQDLLRAKGGWQKFRFLEKLPAVSDPKAVVKCYLWNDNSRGVLLKNMDVRLVKK